MYPNCKLFPPCAPAPRKTAGQHLFPCSDIYINQTFCLELVHLKPDIEERAVRLAEYIIENDTTVRAAAKQFGVSKSTVHKDVTERLRKLNPKLWQQAKTVLEKNKAERHIRGGIATRLKYKGK